MLAGVTREMPAFREEIFGPVAPVTVVKDEAEAIEVANDSEYGLVAAIQTGAVGRGLELARSLRTGMVHVNDQTLNNVRPLRWGRRLRQRHPLRIESSWDEFTTWQWVTSREQAHGCPF